MKAFLLAAGFGKRLRPLTNTIPKCLVPIKGKPLMACWLDSLFGSGCIDSVVINVHYLHDKVEAFISSCQFKDRVELVYEERLMGTAGAIVAHGRYLGAGPLMLIHADNYSLFDVRAFIQAHMDRPSGCLMTMMTFRTDAPHTCGILDLDQRGVVQGFYEKEENPPGNLANGAVYILERNVIDALNPEVFDFSTEVIPRYLGRIYTFENKIYHRDIGNPESYQKAQELK